MDDFAVILTNILTANSIEETAALALQALVRLVRSQAACVLAWDEDLGRYIIAGTWISPDGSSPQPAIIRRRALQAAKRAHQRDIEHAQFPEPGLCYHPLNALHQHVGAYICLGLDQLPSTTGAHFELLIKAVSHALYTITRLQRADHMQDKAKADRERLEQLLKAVEQQQRTIDRLLASERQLSASLEAKVEERTQALRLAQARLIQSEKLAVIGQLASSLAHELNNPLQAIQSGLGLVVDELDGGNTRLAQNDLYVIQQELERIDSIFRQMLDFYRPTASEYLPLDLNAICDGVRILMRKRLQEANVTLHLELTPNLPLTCGDSNQIKQVLLNLLLNAADALAPVGGHVTLHTLRHDQQACISVADDGPGIAPEYLGRLFEPLFTTKTRGLGLGLAISQEIVQRHEGTITVHSLQGKGTTFTIHLPVQGRCHAKQ